MLTCSDIERRAKIEEEKQERYHKQMLLQMKKNGNNNTMGTKLHQYGHSTNKNKRPPYSRPIDVGVFPPRGCIVLTCAVFGSSADTAYNATARCSPSARIP